MFLVPNTIGDIINLINLISTVITALDDNRGSSASYRDFAAELRALEIVVKQIKNTSTLTNPKPDNQVVQCCISELSECESIVKHVNKFLKGYVTLSRPEDQKTFGARIQLAISKLEWLFKKNDIRELRGRIASRRSSLHLLLSALSFEMSASANDASRLRHFTYTPRSTASIGRDDCQARVDPPSQANGYAQDTQGIAFDHLYAAGRNQCGTFDWSSAGDAQQNGVPPPPHDVYAPLSEIASIDQEVPPPYCESSYGIQFEDQNLPPPYEAFRTHGAEDAED